MKKICVIGSINVDIVFSVDAIARPGETISASGTRRYLGGKGQNQAIAL
ncbi:MAG: PfkB family carbohydrate kinase, partial [Bacillota bacterium]|nr:PfkB family carbohydrate kinase [Bacillota bacterium]